VLACGVVGVVGVVGVAGTAGTAAAGDPGPGAASGSEILVGDWYVLIHHRDPSALGSQLPVWDDQIWRIEADGPGLRWSIFPHPEFRDGSGRWEKLPGGEEARTLGAWEPNPDQRGEIARGLARSAQDERSKRLDPVGPQRWASRGGLRAASASQIGYHERWSMELRGAGPIFVREATLGSGRTLSSQAATRFLTRTVAGDGKAMRGEYFREGEAQGEFRMLRMGESRAVKARQ